MKLTQKDVAEAVGVDKCSLFNWEANISQPDLRYIPAVIEFLGYNPLPEANTLGERLVRHRTLRGLSQKEAAEAVGVDPGTLSRWERGEREPMRPFVSRVERFLADQGGQATPARRVG